MSSIFQKSPLGEMFSEKKYSNKQMDVYAKQQSIEFFKWNARKMNSYIEYLQKIKGIIRSEEIEEKLNEFEGATIEERYDLFIKSNENG